ncbi:MAG: Stf0 family sulfotransferase [Chthoniobacterales bacterium]
MRGVVKLTATSNAVFGFRLEAWDLERFVERLRHSGEFGPAEAREIKLLGTAFPRLRCVQLTREDKLRQAVSKARAMQTDLWVGAPEKGGALELKFDPSLIRHCLQSSAKAERTWAEFFARNEIEPLGITYEDLCADYAGTVRRVLDYVEVRLPRGFSLGGPKTVRQADVITEDWVARFKALPGPKLYAFRSAKRERRLNLSSRYPRFAERNVYSARAKIGASR